MSAEIKIMTQYVACQRDLLDSFREAARVINRDVLECLIEADRYYQFDLIRDLAREIAGKVSCPDYLKLRFEDAACSVLVTMVPNLGYIDHSNAKALDEIIEYARFDILARYRDLAVNEELLPMMFESGRQHANHTVSLDR